MIINPVDYNCSFPGSSKYSFEFGFSAGLLWHQRKIGSILQFHANSTNENAENSFIDCNLHFRPGNSDI